MADAVDSENGELTNQVELLDVPLNFKARVDFMKLQRIQVIQLIAVKLLRNAPERELTPRYPKLNKLLHWLEAECTMTPMFKKETLIDKGLEIMIGQLPEYQKYKFPDEYKQRARALYDRWVSENWGANDVIDDEIETDDNDNDRDKVRGPSVSKMNEDSFTVLVRLPPPSHPIWGLAGIMHGVAFKEKGKRRDYILDPRYIREKRNAKVYGDNGFTSGDWFPFQIVALFRGLHGVRMGGIAGDSERGAYSIVVSGTYDSLDTDSGEVLHYSGSGSHDNTDPKRPAKSTSATLCLHASLASGNPVRVIRSASGKSKFAPIYGVRYDGLYNVVELLHPRNQRGGVYEQFKLQRRPGQPKLARGIRPTAAEMQLFEQIGQRYW